jgi:hypothetical protein
MQNVGTPRIYVNDIAWNKAIGVDIYNPRTSGFFSEEQTLKFVDGNPVNIFEKTFDGSTYNVQYNKINTTESNYIAFLGHNFVSAKIYPRHRYLKADGAWNGGNSLDNIVNGNNGGITYHQDEHNEFVIPDYDGFSICSIPSGSIDGDHSCESVQFNITDDDYLGAGQHTLKLGSIFMGRYYDFPHSPDLNLTMTIENDGITTQQTKGGATLTNARYTGAPKWGDLGAWELQSSPPNYWNFDANLGARTGRRSWNLTFSYLSDKQTLPVNALGSAVANNDTMDGYEEGTDWWNSPSVGGIFGAQYSPLNVLNGEDFFSSVWNKTMGGHLPFIFQQDKNNSNPDQFAICRFDMDSLQVKQVAYNTYTISLKIRECW